MNKTTKAAILAASLIAMALAPVGGAVSETKYVTGPAGFFSDELGGIGGAACLGDDANLGTPPAASCEQNPGSIQSVGGAFFDVSGFESIVSTGVHVDLTVTHLTGTYGGGYQASACSDLDDDSFVDVCSDYYTTNGMGYANSINFSHCALRDTGNLLDPTQDMDDFVVFIFSWADTTAVDEGTPIVVGVPDPTAPGNLVTLTVWPNGDPSGSESDTVAASSGDFEVVADYGVGSNC